jgi:hypothetical protein
MTGEMSDYLLLPMIYVGGPFTNIENGNMKSLTDIASDVSLELWERGWSVISCHKNLQGYLVTDKVPYDQWIKGTLSQIARCDAVIFIGDWENSKGCLMEMKFANDRHIPVYDNNIDGIPSVPRFRKYVIGK